MAIALSTIGGTSSLFRTLEKTWLDHERRGLRPCPVLYQALQILHILYNNRSVALLTSLGTGQLSWLDGSAAGRLALQGGFAEVLSGKVTVLAMIAELPEEIDAEAARAALAAAEATLKTASAEEFDELTAAVRLAETRIQVAGGGAA